jgi:hypothetical protein
MGFGVQSQLTSTSGRSLSQCTRHQLEAVVQLDSLQPKKYNYAAMIPAVRRTTPSQHIKNPVITLSKLT